MAEKLKIDSSGGEEVETMPTYEEVRSKELEGYRERASELGREYQQIERDFDEKYPGSLTKYADDPEKQKFYNKFFIEKYENEIASNRREANLCTKPLGLDGYELADLEKIDIVQSKLERTVEVKSSDLYVSRREALQNKLNEEGTEEEKHLLANTYGLILEYADYKFADTSGYALFEHQMHDKMRTEAHNKVIEQLNAMNDLANKYGERPFTCRNFVTSRNYSEEKDKEFGMAYRDRASSDRKIVDFYFSRAYESAMIRAKRQAERG